MPPEAETHPGARHGSVEIPNPKAGQHWNVSAYSEITFPIAVAHDVNIRQVNITSFDIPFIVTEPAVGGAHFCPEQVQVLVLDYNLERARNRSRPTSSSLRRNWDCHVLEPWKKHKPHDNNLPRPCPMPLSSRAAANNSAEQHRQTSWMVRLDLTSHPIVVQPNGEEHLVRIQVKACKEGEESAPVGAVNEAENSSLAAARVELCAGWSHAMSPASYFEHHDLVMDVGSAIKEGRGGDGFNHPPQTLRGVHLIGKTHYTCVPQVWTMDRRHEFGPRINRVADLLLSHCGGGGTQKDDAEDDLSSQSLSSSSSSNHSTSHFLSLSSSIWQLKQCGQRLFLPHNHGTRLSDEALEAWKRLPAECVILILQMCASGWFGGDKRVVKKSGHSWKLYGWE